MRTEVIKITDTLEVIRDVDNPDFVDFTTAWQQHAPRDKNGSPDKSMRPIDWSRLPTTKGHILALRNTLSRSGKIPLRDLMTSYRGGNLRGKTFGHYMLLLAYLQYLNPALHVEANLYFLRFKAGDPTLIDEIYRNASVEGKARAELRMKSILKRRSFTDELAAHGCGSDDFGRITNAGYEESFDKNALQLRQSLGITKKSQPLRDVMPPDMLDQVQLYEGLAAAKMNKDKAQGAYVCETTTRNASRMIREFLEK